MFRVFFKLVHVVVVAIAFGMLLTASFAQSTACSNAIRNEAVKLCTAIINDKLSTPDAIAKALRSRAAAQFDLQLYQFAFDDLNALYRRGLASEDDFLLIAESSAKRQRSSIAVEAFRRALSMTVDPGSNKFKMSFDRIAIVLNRDKQHADLIALAKEYLSRVPNSALSRYWLGWAQYELGNLDAAWHENKIILSSTDVPIYLIASAHNNQGLILKRRGQLDQALISFNRAVNSNPSHRFVFENRGSLLLELGRAKEALADFEVMYAREKIPSSLNNKAEALIALGQIDDAYLLATSAQRLKQLTPHAYILSGKIRRLQGKLAEAESFFKEARDRDPKGIWPRYWLALVVLEQGRFDEAVTILELLSKSSGQQVEVRMLLGNAYLQMGRVKDALAVHKDVLVLGPSSSDAFANLAITYGYLGQWRECLKYAEMAVAANGRNVRAIGLRSDAQWWLGNMEAALAGYNALLELQPRADEYLEKRGQLHIQRGFPKLALVDFEAALNVRKTVQRLRGMAEALVLLKRIEEASKVQADADVLERLAPNFFPPNARLLFIYSVGELLRTLDDTWITYLSKAKFHSLAIDRLTTAIKEGRGISWHYEQRAYANYSLKKFREAAADFKEVLTYRPHDQIVREKYGHALFELSQYTDALKQYYELAEVNRTARTLSFAGHSLMYLGRFSEAETVFKEARGMPDSDEQTWILGGQLERHSGNYKAAESYFLRALAHDPKAKIAHYWIGKLRQDEGRNKEAFQIFSDLAKIWPDSMRLQVDIGMTYVDQAQYEKSLVYFAKAVELEPKNAEGPEHRALANLHLRRWTEAISDAEIAIARDGKSWLAHARRANANWQLEKMIAARADYDRAVELAPKVQWLLEERAEFLLAEGSYELALQQIDAVIKGKNPSSNAYRLRALSAENLGRYEEAVNYYSIAMGVPGARDSFLDDRAYAYVGLGQPLKALADCNSFIVRQRDDPDAYRCRARVNSALRNDAGAIADLDRALRIKSSVPAANYERGQIFLSLERWEEAENDFTMAIKSEYMKSESHYFRALSREGQQKLKGASADFELALRTAKRGWANLASYRLQRLQRRLPHVKTGVDFTYPQSIGRSIQ